MKKTNKKLALARETVRALSLPELDGVVGGNVQPTPPVRYTVAGNTAPCRASLAVAAGFACRTTTV